MLATVVLVAAALVAYWAVSLASGLRANIAKARQCDLPYIVIPCSYENVLWQITHKFWVFWIRLLPKRLWENWLFVMLPDWGYTQGQQPWDRFGDTFLVVSPGHIILNTQSPSAIHQITARREHFPKATMHYSILEIFGRNILTTEGAVWRFHRKTTSASFNERNAAHTFAEAIRQTQGLVAKWAATTDAARTITTVEKDTMTLALNIIGYVGFGIRFTWPGEPLPADANDDNDSRMLKYSSHSPPPGHTMTFSASVEQVLHRIILLLLLPQWLLRVLGVVFRAPREAHEAHRNYVQYMTELLVEKATAAREARRSDGMDLMGQLVRGRYEDEKQAADKGQGQEAPSEKNSLTDDEIIGNAFIMLVAGHETTANTLHFTIVQLACSPASQRALQADIDRLLGRDSDPTTWNYESSIGLLSASMLGAAINETLRLMPPVVIVPKWVTPQADQPVALAETGRTHVLPAAMNISLCIVSAHRNPRHWPAAKGGGGSSSDNEASSDGRTTDLDAFLPERWFRTGGSSEAIDAAADAAADATESEDDSEVKDPLLLPTSSDMFRPVRGSFVPFSDGPRSCLGRRIAQVEMLAAVAVLFQRYSVELAVDEWADDAQVAAMDADARRALYAKAQAKAQATLRSASSALTLKLHGTAGVAVRLVPRGEERFGGIV